MPRTFNLHTFSVCGTGLFPFDMLRADRCTPARENDSAAIERTTHRRPGGPITVTLTGRHAPNEARWKSFGWTVQAHNVVRAEDRP